MTLRATLLSAGLGLALAASAGAQATFQPGYTLGSGLLGDDLLVDAATHAGLGSFDLRANDTGNGAGPYNFAVVYQEAWDIGAEVSITGIALPLRNPNMGTVNNTANGTFTFSFYELGGGANPDAWDGLDNGETVLATRDVIYNGAGIVDEAYSFGATVPWAVFDTPINFTASSTGFAVSVDSTSSIRTRFDTTPNPTDGLHFVLSNGNQQPSGAGHKWTIAGTPVIELPDPPPTTNGAAAHRFAASADTPIDDEFWTPVATSAEFYTVDDDVAPISISDSAVPGITAAYDINSTGRFGGRADVFDLNIFANETQASRQDGSFEIWFKPDSLTGGEQILYELGGSGRGAYFSLQDDVLSFYVKGEFPGNEQTVSTTLSSDDWTQVVGVINNTFSADSLSDDDFLELYVNGVLVDSNSTTTTDINDWSGGNQGGLGGESSSFAGSTAQEGPINGVDNAGVVDFPFLGQIAAFEYTPGALSSQDVADRFAEVTTAGLRGDYNGDGMVDAADYTVWRDNLGGDAATVFPAGTRGVAGAGPIGIGDYQVWKSQFGATAAVLAANAPEPGSLMLLATGVCLCGRRRRL
ncbi:MAG: LamG-like jellyroll fold domain-containing protein [Planctomycetota bacterium]